MTINSVNILFSWYDEDEKLLKELKKRADDGNQECLADFIGIQTELSTNEDEVKANLAALKKLSDHGISRASLVLGVLYNEGLCKDSKVNDSEIFIEQDFETSDLYLERAAKENNPVALFMLSLHTWFRHSVFDYSDDEEYPCQSPNKEDFEKGKKWMEKFISLASDNSLDEESREYIQKHMPLVQGWLKSFED